VAENKMIRFIRGIITFILCLLNAIFVIVVVTPLGLFRFIPITFIQKNILKINERFGELYLYLNSRIQDLMHSPDYKVYGQDKLKRDIWQFTTINHLSWADIFLYLYFCNFKQSCPRVFMKAQLWWLPITWTANIGLAMPFVVRRSKEAIKANPQLAQTDKNSTIRACRTYKIMPTNVAGFIEGTRIDKEKYLASNSKFKNLMPPKIGGMGYTLEVMPYIDHLTDVTLVYKSDKRAFWNFLCGDMREASVTINTYKIPEELRGVDYTDNQEMRDKLKAFLESIWEEKDRIIEKEKEKYGIKTVF
jgi:1-acyl-sn-glycerol-3-phosphate acyltransferase